jgi:hypothetical protein
MTIMLPLDDSFNFTAQARDELGCRMFEAFYR